MLTSDLSMQLCDQLRIIMEPSLATKLAGDFRNGKRINMKKVIPYIASQFRKDKIWLKRTKPSKRQYQVLVAIDDSLSMSANGAGRLALEAMTTICKALTYLDVGQIGVVSFGEKVQLLHEFSKPFSEEAGSFIISNFTFNQQKTMWANFLETTVNLLDDAKKNVTSEEKLQLVFIISDARIQQERDTIGKWCREAAEKKQLLVMIVVDTIENDKSILSLKSVTYPNGKLKVVNYLESFPFPYYIILKELQSLPEIVSDALRQWFEMIQETL